MLSGSASFKTIAIETDDFKIGNSTFKSELAKSPESTEQINENTENINILDNKVSQNTQQINENTENINILDNKITEITKPNKKYLFTIKDFIRTNPSISLISSEYSSVIYDSTIINGALTLYVKFPENGVDISNGGIPYIGIVKLDENLIIDPNNNIEYYLNMANKNDIVNDNLSDEIVTFLIQSYDDEQNLVSSKTLNIFSYKDSLDIFNEKLIRTPLLTEPYTTKKNDVIVVLFSRMRANGSSTGIITVNVKFT